MLTPAQIQLALLISNYVDINFATPPANRITPRDVTNWTGVLGLVPGADTAKMLLSIVDPFGLPVYTNTGYNSNDYSAPDIQFNINQNGPTGTLPNVTGTSVVVSGNYHVYVKVEVVQGGNPPVYATKTFTTNIDASHLLRTGSLKGTYDCFGNPTSFTVTDETNLGDNLYSYLGVTRTLTLIPPAASGQAPVTGNSNVLTKNNLWSAAPYQYSVSGQVDYSLGNDFYYVYYTATGYTDVICNDVLCKMYCCLVGIRKDYYAEKNLNQKSILNERLWLGFMEYHLAVRARICGDNEAISDYISKFYEVTKCNPNCDCCDNFGPAPVISECACTNGIDGKTPEFQMAGTWFQWRYIGDPAWINLFNFASLIGPPGQDGQDGVTILINNTDVASTSGTGWQTLKSKTLPPDTLSNDFDMLHIKARFNMTGGKITPNISGTVGKFCQIVFGPTPTPNNPIAGGVILGSFYDNVFIYDFDIYLTRINNSTIRYICYWEQSANVFFFNNAIAGRRYSTGQINIAGLNLSAISYDIACQGRASVPGVSNDDFKIMLYRYGSTTVSNQMKTHEYLLTADLTYTFDGTITVYNPSGIDLRNKTLVQYESDGRVRTIIGGEYNFNPVTGAITIPSTMPGTPAKLIYI